MYNGIDPYLGESSAQTRLQWIDALDKLGTLNARAVVAGHKIPDNDDDPKNIAATRQYLRDFIRLDQATDTPRELFDAMIELYPDRANPGSLWGGANAAKREAGNGTPSVAAVRDANLVQRNERPAMRADTRAARVSPPIERHYATGEPTRV